MADQIDTIVLSLIGYDDFYNTSCFSNSCIYIYMYFFLSQFFKCIFHSRSAIKKCLFSFLFDLLRLRLLPSTMPQESSCTVTQMIMQQRALTRSTLTPGGYHQLGCRGGRFTMTTVTPLLLDTLLLIQHIALILKMLRTFLRSHLIPLDMVMQSLC